MSERWDERQAADGGVMAQSGGWYSVQSNLVVVAAFGGLACAIHVLFFGSPTGCVGRGPAALSSRTIVENFIASAPLWMSALSDCAC